MNWFMKNVGLGNCMSLVIEIIYILFGRVRNCIGTVIPEMNFTEY